MVECQRKLAADELMRRRRRPGMSLIEVIFAIVILSGVLLAMTRFGDRFVKSSGQARWAAIASDLAAARLEYIRAWPVRNNLVAEFDKQMEPEPQAARPAMSNAPGFFRSTIVTLVGGTNLVRVTVTVWGMGVEVSKTTEIFTR